MSVEVRGIFRMTDKRLCDPDCHPKCRPSRNVVGLWTHILDTPDTAAMLAEPDRPEEPDGNP